MRGLPYYEEPEYHKYLLSAARGELFPPDPLLSQISWEGVENLLDFGMGNGYFLPHFYKYIGKDCQVWGAECQEILIDATLKMKVDEDFQNFIPFHTPRTEHPLLPDWIPEMDLIFCSCTLSTFADPSLAIHGIGRSLNTDGKIIIIDWERMDSPSGPELAQKISKDRMEYFIEEADYRVDRNLKTNPYIYGMIISPRQQKKSYPAPIDEF